MVQTIAIKHFLTMKKYKIINQLGHPLTMHADMIECIGGKVHFYRNSDDYSCSHGFKGWLVCVVPSDYLVYIDEEIDIITPKVNVQEYHTSVIDNSESNEMRDYNGTIKHFKE